MKLVALLCMLMVPSLIIGNEYFTILTKEDYQLINKFNADGPFIHTLDGSFQSYLKWSCFEINQLDDIFCNKNNKPLELPGFIVSNKFYFEAPSKTTSKCTDVIKSWNSLLVGSDQICILNAEIPVEKDKNDPTLYADIYKIKTNTGTWDSGYFLELF